MFIQQDDNVIFQSVTQNVNKVDVVGIGFDATCSMVVLDKSGQPLSISPTGMTLQ